MSFLSHTHEREFNSALTRINKDNNNLVSAVYLLTADYLLWKRCRHSVSFNAIDFEEIQVGSISERAYTLYVSAKDLYIGTKHLTVADLCDETLLSDNMFGLICNAMAIHRFGLVILPMGDDEVTV